MYIRSWVGLLVVFTSTPLGNFPGTGRTAKRSKKKQTNMHVFYYLLKCMHLFVKVDMHHTLHACFYFVQKDIDVDVDYSHVYINNQTSS